MQARHEESGGVHGGRPRQVHGSVGVVLVDPGPGRVHLLNGLYDAKLDGLPGGRNRRPAEAAACSGPAYHAGGGPAERLFEDVAPQFAQLVRTPEQVPMVIDRAFRTALATRSPAVVIVPHDVQKAAAAGARRTSTASSSPPRQWRPPDVRPDDEDLDRGGRRATRTGAAGGPARRAGRPRTRRTRWWLSPSGSAPVLRRACWESRLSTNHCRSPSAPWATWARRRAPPAGRLRHPADRRHRTTRGRSSTRRRARPAQSRSTSTGGGSATDIRSRYGWSARPAGTLRALLPLLAPGR